MEKKDGKKIRGDCKNICGGGVLSKLTM